MYHSSKFTRHCVKFTEILQLVVNLSLPLGLIPNDEPKEPWTRQGPGIRLGGVDFKIKLMQHRGSPSNFFWVKKYP